MVLVASVLFFASLLAHELGHALVARREGMQAEGITLWLFGGVARFKGMFPSAGAELRIALAGPLVTLVLGAIFVLVAWGSGLPVEVDGVAAWLGYVNLLLLGFNLLPALPLDGGRVLRALLWGGRRDFAWATRLAAEIGRGFGFFFIGLGIARLHLPKPVRGHLACVPRLVPAQRRRCRSPLPRCPSGARRLVRPRPDGPRAGQRPS